MNAVGVFRDLGRCLRIRFVDFVSCAVVFVSFFGSIVFVDCFVFRSSVVRCWFYLAVQLVSTYGVVRVVWLVSTYNVV